MKELIKFTFDFFVHVLPGFFIILSVSLLFIDVDCITFDIECIKGLGKKIGEFEAKDGIVLAVIAYVIGFAIHPLGKFMYIKLGLKLWKREIENKVDDMFISDQFVLIRQFSPKNFEYVETWNTYCAMSHNLSIASLFLFVVSLIKVILPNKPGIIVWIWIPVALIALLLFFIFLYRAVIFWQWAGRDLNASITTLKLYEKELKK